MRSLGPVYFACLFLVFILYFTYVFGSKEGVFGSKEGRRWKKKVVFLCLFASREERFYNTLKINFSCCSVVFNSALQILKNRKYDENKVIVLYCNCHKNRK